MNIVAKMYFLFRYLYFKFKYNMSLQINEVYNRKHYANSHLLSSNWMGNCTVATIATLTDVTTKTTIATITTNTSDTTKI